LARTELHSPFLACTNELREYDTELGGYRVNLTADKLQNAPKYTQSTGWNWSRENDRKVYDYYQAKPYW
jgi:hypothetical protein